MNKFPLTHVECDLEETKIVNECWWHFFDESDGTRCYSIANYRHKPYISGIGQKHTYFIANYTQRQET